MLQGCSTSVRATRKHVWRQPYLVHLVFTKQVISEYPNKSEEKTIMKDISEIETKIILVILFISIDKNIALAES